MTTPTVWTEEGRSPSSYKGDINLTEHISEVDPHPQYPNATEFADALALKAPLLSPLFRPTNAGSVGLIVKGEPGQSADYLRLVDNTDVQKFAVTANGTAKIGGDTNAFSQAHIVVQDGPGGQRGLSIRGASGQIGNLAEFQNNAGTVSTRIGPEGAVGLNMAGSGNAWLAITGTVASDRLFLVRGLPSQTGNLTEFQNSAGTVLTRVDQNGSISTLAVIAMLPTNPATRPLLVQGAAGQSANLAEFQNSAGTVLSGFDNIAQLFVRCFQTNGAEVGVRTVKVGVADSGGVGFRTLIVSN